MVTAEALHLHENKQINQLPREGKKKNPNNQQLVCLEKPFYLSFYSLFLSDLSSLSLSTDIDTSRSHPLDPDSTRFEIRRWFCIRIGSGSDSSWCGRGCRSDHWSSGTVGVPGRYRIPIPQAEKSIQMCEDTVANHWSSGSHQRIRTNLMVVDPGSLQDTVTNHWSSGPHQRIRKRERGASADC